ncbi:MAG: class I SAM-dependent methyltransferase [Candidatus Omnitrophica bacterium]|nr:class I SAM-dependent methyltransferase [Candidatus Omnitrophota bacterium]
MAFLNLNIFSRIKNYRKLSKELQEILAKNPADAPKFQGIFNLTVDRIYQDIMDFEKANIEKFESEVYRFKKIFEKRYRQYFVYGEYVKWCVDKPFGYAGDFKIIDDIYLNQVRTEGFDSLWDRWFQQLAASCAVRERKEDFKKIIYDFIKNRRNEELRVMDLGCGSCREIRELFEIDSDGVLFDVIFDCYDFDIRAIEYAKQLLNNLNNVNFFQKNAIRLALRKDIKDEIGYKYDLIYSSGLFDYLDERIAVRLINNLNRLLKQDGIMIISNVRDKYSNTSSIWMEWIGEWYLIYRTESEFEKIFIDSGISPKNIKIIPQHSKIMQYCLIKNS